VLAQILKLLPRHEFEAAASRHHSGRKLRGISRWEQFVALAVAQLTKRNSLRDLLANFSAQRSKLYHLGVRVVSRSTLARVNQNQPAALFEELFHKLLSRTERHAPGHRFRFKSRLISLDASLLEVTASLFPWAKYQAIKGAIKLHVGLDHAGHLPAFVTVT
jgi:putative transposase